jgi:hypothetical protein
MANKRMFSKDIVGSDAFQDMPASSQLLYFHLGMEADDDGFIGNPKKIARSIGMAEDDMKILVSKRFVLLFPSGVLVIKHHRINNNWDKYNCKRTMYMEEFSQLYLKENKAYTTDKTQGKPLQSENSLKTVFRIEENRIDKNRIEDKLSNESVSHKTLKEYRDLRRQQIGNPPMTPRKSTEKQKAFMAAAKSGIEYFKAQGQEQHGMQFLEYTNDKRNAIVLKLVMNAYEKIGDLKELIDWWFEGEGEWADYEPEQCFSIKTIERFKNKDKIKKGVNIIKL